MNFWQLIYNILVIPLLWTTFHLAGFLNGKIRRGIQGRKRLLDTLEVTAQHFRSPYRLWFHSSSMGEFEQAKPIIAAIKRLHPAVEIIVTFFSPSGYEHSKNYKLASLISYIPFDSRSNAQRFLDIIKPSVAIMVRYDIWPNFIWELQERKIPTLIANATMRVNSLRKLPILRQFHSGVYNCFSHILTVSENDKKAFEGFTLSPTEITAIGDTRFDQVKMRSLDAINKHPIPSPVLEGKKVFVVGQSWEADEDVILPALFKLQKLEPSLLTILVPHEPTIEHLEFLEYRLERETRYIRFSDMIDYRGEDTILIDSVGILVALYKYAHLAYVGGSFRQGVHNVLEPAVFGIPVIYGPKHSNSQEAMILVQRGGGFVVENDEDVLKILHMLLNDDPLRNEAGRRARTFVDENTGATQRFLHHIAPLLPS